MPVVQPTPAATVYAITNEAGMFAFRDINSQTPETTIHVGDTVLWINKTSDEHTIVNFMDPAFITPDPPFSGDIINAEDQYPYQFNQPGDVGYYCDLHTGNPKTHVGMWGIVHVLPRIEVRR